MDRSAELMGNKNKVNFFCVFITSARGRFQITLRSLADLVQKWNSNEKHQRYRIERKLQTKRREQYKTRVKYCNEEFEEKTIVSKVGLEVRIM